MHVLIICARRYNGHELWTSLGMLKRRHHTFELCSTDYVIRDEITNQPNRIKTLIRDSRPEDYGAFMIISGNMQDTEAYWKDKEVLDRIHYFNQLSLPIAAICCSVPTIRFAATNKKVSFFPLVRSRDLLKSCGAILQTVAMTRDQNLVTAEHQMATQIQVEEFCNLMEGIPPQIVLQDSGFTPKGHERKPIPIVERIRAGQANQSASTHS
jgi:putative intracellular protease/amidase